MSRGYGYVQRFVLDEIDGRFAAGDQAVPVDALAERLAGGTPTRSTFRSIRRAVRLLAEDGLVELDSGVVTIARVDELETRVARRADARDLRRQLRE